MREPDYNLPILLVDDDALVRDVVEQYLRTLGFQRIISLGNKELLSS